MSDDWNRQRKISTLKNCKADAVTVLARTLEKAQAGKIKSVYIGIHWDDDSFDADWSSMSSLDLIGHVEVARATGRDVFIRKQTDE